MSRLVSITLIFLVSAINATAGAQEPARRSLTSCMSRRMSADRMISYNEAHKICREQLKNPDAKPDTAANSAPKPVG